MADARTRSSDVRLPVVPRACRVAGVLVPRRFGRVCVAPGSELGFLALRRVFPALESSTPLEVEDEDLARYALAESILCLDLEGSLPRRLVDEAALYGVPPADALEQARALLTDPALAAREVAAVTDELDEEELGASLARAKHMLAAAPLRLEVAG
jgi:hypothetical protein